MEDIILKAFGGSAGGVSKGSKPKEEKVKNSETHDSAGLLFDEAMKHFENKDYEKSISDLTKAIEQSPDHEAAYYYQRGLGYSRIENYKSAIEDFSKVIEVNPDYLDAYYQRGRCYLDRKSVV